MISHNTYGRRSVLSTLVGTGIGYSFLDPSQLSATGETGDTQTIDSGWHSTTCCGDVDFPQHPYDHGDQLTDALGVQPTKSPPKDPNEGFDHYEDASVFRFHYYDGFEDDKDYIKEKLFNAISVWDGARPGDSTDISPKVHVKLLRADEWRSTSYLSAGAFYTDGQIEHARIRFVTPSDHPRTGDERDIWYRKNMVHEYGHILQYQDREDSDAGMSIPQWFSEGQVEYVAVFESDEEIFDHYMDRGNWRMMESQLIFNGGHSVAVADDAYQGGSYLVKFMIEEWGHDTVHTLLKTDNRHFTSIFPNELGISSVEFEQRWLTWLNETFDADYEIPIFGSNEELVEEIETLEDEVTDLEAQLSELEGETNALGSELDEAQAKNEEYIQTIEELQDEIAALEDELDSPASTPTPTPDSTPTPTLTPPLGETPTPTSSSSDDSIPGFGITAALSGLGGAAYLLKRRLAGDDSESD